jgi:hypothetical protein
MALVSPGIQVSINDQSQYVNSNVGSVPLVVLATAQDKVFNNAVAQGTTEANAGKLLAFTSQRDLVTAMGTPTFQLSSAGTPINGSELNEYGLLTAYSALGLGNRLFAIRADIDLNELQGTSVRPVGTEADGTVWLDLVNTEFGIYSLNAPTSSFNHISPLLITDETQVQTINVDANGNSVSFNVPTPVASIGSQGSYALVFVNTDGTTPTNIRLFYKATVASYGGVANTWLQVGSAAWQNATPVLQGVNASPSLTNTMTFIINGQTVTVTHNSSTITQLAADINSANITGVKAASVNGLLTFFVTNAAVSGKAVITDGTGAPLALCGVPLTAGTTTVYPPILFYGSYAQQPNASAGGWFSTDPQPRPTGSIWIKTTATGGGFSPALKQFSLATDTWVPVSAPMYPYSRSAIYGLDPVGGGINIAQGQKIVSTASTDATANQFKILNQIDAIQTVGTGVKPTGFSAGLTFQIGATSPGTDQLTSPFKTLSTSGTNAQSFVADILSLNIPYVTAQVNSDGTISVIHTTGGQIQIIDTNGAFANAGFTNGSSQTVSTSGTTITISNFVNVTSTITYSTYTPYAAPVDGALWYYSNPADIDIMINDGGWKSYRTVSSDVRGYALGATDPMGVIVSATVPKNGDRSDNGNLVAGELWLDSSDLVNFPKLSRYTGTTWVSIDNTDHTSNNGIIFADARWDTGGTTDVISAALPAIDTLLENNSNYIDLDAPDYRLYPRGTLLFNTRRSGFNVKKFVSNYFNSTSFPNASLPTVRDAWVTVSGNKEDGSMYAGSAAQRALIVAAMKSAVDSNTDLLDSNYAFNLFVAPGYPELIPNLVTLNDNRSDTGFIIGDTPMTLAPTSSALSAWESNANGNGLATASPYLAVYYPAGLTNDLAGNTVAVPASHAVLRTYLFNDQVAYQWFAPAGVHRGLVDNLSDIGYVDAQSGAFVHNGINNGLRDTLFTMNINPITQLPGTGLVVFGQETRSGDSTARNRVNVVRLENYLRTIFNGVANSFLFEPNDTITRKSIAGQIESALHDVLSKRGLYDFLVICDTSNNTSSTIAANQLYVDVAIEPMKDVEFIYIPVALYNPGTIATLGASST